MAAAGGIGDRETRSPNGEDRGRTDSLCSWLVKRRCRIRSVMRRGERRERRTKVMYKTKSAMAHRAVTRPVWMVTSGSAERGSARVISAFRASHACSSIGLTSNDLVDNIVRRGRPGLVPLLYHQTKHRLGGARRPSCGRHEVARGGRTRNVTRTTVISVSSMVAAISQTMTADWMRDVIRMSGMQSMATLVAIAATVGDDSYE